MGETEDDRALVDMWIIERVVHIMKKPAFVAWPQGKMFAVDCVNNVIQLTWVAMHMHKNEDEIKLLKDACGKLYP